LGGACTALLICAAELTSVDLGAITIGVKRDSTFVTAAGAGTDFLAGLTLQGNQYRASVSYNKYTCSVKEVIIIVIVVQQPFQSIALFPYSNND